jgi:hypothetical protein
VSIKSLATDSSRNLLPAMSDCKQQFGGEC